MNRKSIIRLLLISASLVGSTPVLAQSGEVIMRRPLPGSASPGGTDPNVDPNDGDPQASYMTYAAVSMCGPDGNYLVGCLGEDSDTGDRSEADLQACRFQNPATSDYRYLASDLSYYGLPVVAPSQIDAVNGSPCGGETAPQTYYAVQCQGSGSQAYGSCYKVDASRTSGGAVLVNSIRYESNDQNCLLSQEDTRPETQSVMSSVGMTAATTEGTALCLKNNPDAFYMAKGVCKTLIKRNADNSLTINTEFVMDCRALRPTPGGDSPFAMSYAFSGTCGMAENTQQQKDYIAVNYSPEFSDPKDLDTSCNNGVTLIGDPKMEVQSTPRSSDFLYQEYVRPYAGAYANTNVPLRQFEEKYTFYCHRYDFPIFEGIPVLPAITEDTRYVEVPNYNDEIGGPNGLGYNCENEAYNAAFALRQSYQASPGVQECLDITSQDISTTVSCLEYDVDFQSGPTSRAGTITIKYGDVGPDVG